MIGATAAEFQDLWSTPLGPARPGVWIQAIAYRTLAAEQAGLPVLAAPGSRRGARARGAAVGVVAASLSQLSHARRSAALAALAGWLARASARRAAGDPRLAARSRRPARPARGALRARPRARAPALPAPARRARALAHDALQRRRGDRGAGSGDMLGVALSLLGDVVGASRRRAAARARPTGELDGRRVDWGRAGGAAIGDDEAAARCLRAQDVRVYARRRARPQRRRPRVYAPLFAGDVPVGVLVVERRAASRSTRPSCARSRPSARRSRSRSRTCAWSRACARPSTPRSRRSRARSRRATATRSCTAGGSRSSRR